METTYEALEDAGISLQQTRGTDTAVFVGQMTADFHDVQLRSIDTLAIYAATGGTRSITSNRLSYFFDWHGPSGMVRLPRISAWERIGNFSLTFIISDIGYGMFVQFVGSALCCSDIETGRRSCRHSGRMYFESWSRNVRHGVKLVDVVPRGQEPHV